MIPLKPLTKGENMYLYDTCALINRFEDIKEKFCLSEVTLRELENLKSDKRKDEFTKHRIRAAIKWLYDADVTVIPFGEGVKFYLQKWGWEASPDNIIIATAACRPECEFVTDDICCSLLAKDRGLKVAEFPPKELYRGYRKVEMTDEEMAVFFSYPDKNIYELNVNEYLIVGDLTYKWNGERYQEVYNERIKTLTWGQIKPLDAVQRCAIDSIKNNQITLLYGRAGSGKTLLPMAYAEEQIEKGHYNNVTFIYSYDVLKGAKDLGYEKGDHTTKLLNYGAIGNILGTKYGDISAVEQKIESGDLKIYPTAYIRGMSISNSIVIVTEAQNLDSYTLKTIIQRCEDDCKLIIEGDMIEQTDTNISMRGMERFIEVFKGCDKVGIIKLKENYRSEIGELADGM